MKPGRLIGRGRTAEIYDQGEERVLKLFYEWCPGHWAENEARVTDLIYQQGIKAPRVYDLVELDHRRGIIFEKIEGHTMLKELSTSPWRMVGLAREMAELQAKLHTIKVPGLHSLNECLEHDIREVEILPEDRKKEVIRSLRQLPEGERVCHYDFHPDNIMLSPRGAVIIDWSCPMLGDPMADVARTSLLLTIGEPPPGKMVGFMITSMRSLFYSAYLKHYLKLHPDPEERISLWKLPVAAARLNDRIPAEKETLLRMVMTGEHRG